MTAQTTRTAAAGPAGPVILTGGSVWTGAGAPGQAPQRAAVAIAGGQITAIGPDDEIATLTSTITGSGPEPQVLHIPGCLVVPGFQDAHVHPPFGGRFLLHLSLHDGQDVPAHRTAIRRYAQDHPGRAWIYGSGWEAQHFGAAGPHRNLLDDLVPDRPVFLFNASIHEAWVNSRALALAGLQAGTPDPSDGRYGRDAVTGELTGHLVEGAAYRFESAHVPPPSRSEHEQAILAAQAHLHALGITAWQDAWVTPPILDAYRALADSGQLTARVRAALWWERDRGLDQIEGFVAARARADRPGLSGLGGLSAGTVKIMVDGVIENHSASLLAPYHLDCESPGSGSLYVGPEQLRDAVIALDRRGFQVHLHTIGDRAVRVALDAIEAAGQAHGGSGHGSGRRSGRARHTLAHLQLIDPADMPRFAQLGVVATCQPYWAQNEPAMDELTLPVLGADRAALQYPFASLAASGAVLAMGSDWTVSTADPLAQIEVAVRRTGPSRRGGVPFLPDERLTLDAALRAFTSGSAFVNHDPDGGVLAPGLRADLAVLSQNPFEALTAADPFATTIADAQVEYTITSGRIVHARR